MVYGLLRALPGDRALLPPSSAEYCIRQLGSSVGEPGPHGFARPLWRSSSKSASASTAARPANVTIATRPSQWDRMAKDIVLGFSSVKRNFCNPEYLPEGLDSASGLVNGLACRSGTFARYTAWWQTASIRLPSGSLRNAA